MVRTACLALYCFSFHCGEIAASQSLPKVSLGQLEVLPQVESLGTQVVLASVCLMPSPTVQFLCPLTLDTRQNGHMVLSRSKILCSV